MLMRAAPVGAHESDGVGVVHHHQRVVALGELADVRQRCEVAVHGENAVGDDQAKSSARAVFELTLEIFHVTVRIPETLRLAQPDAVDDARVIQSVRDDRVLVVEQRLEDAAVGVEAGWMEDRVFRAEEISQRILELFVNFLRAADEPDGRHAVTPAVQRFLRGRDDGWMVGQAQVVVGAEVQHLAVENAHHRSLRTRQEALLFF